MPTYASPNRDRAPLRWLLRCYPAAFRRRFAEQILVFWEAQRAEARYARPLVGGVRYWSDVARDALGNGLRLRRQPRPGADLDLKGRAAASQPSSTLTTVPRRFAVMFQDLRYAGRSLVRQPFFSLVAISTLAIGIGSTTAVFGIVDSVLFRPLPYSQPHELIRLGRLSEASELRSLALPEVKALAELDAFSALSPLVHYGTDVQWKDRAEIVNGASAGHALFEVLGVSPVLGRTFTAAEDVPGGPRVVLISARLWQREFAGEADVIGATMGISGEPYAIVGIMPDGIDFQEGPIDFWTPFRDAELIRNLDLNPDTRDLVFFNAIARLAPGVSVERAQLEIQSLFQALDVDEPVDGRATRGWGESLHEVTVGSSRVGLLLFLGAVGLVFVIACANVAGLWLTRVASRSTEVAVRTALGAGQGRIVTQLLTESLVLATAGGVAGVGLALALQRGLLAIVPSTIPRLDSVSIDARVLGFAFLLALLAAGVFGTVPAWRAARGNSALVLRESGRGTVEGKTTAQRLLVVGQVAVAVVLLAGAGLFANSYARLLRVDLGIRPEGLITARLSPTITDGETGALRSFYAELVPRVRRLPGVRDVAFTYSPPMSESYFIQSVRSEAMDETEDGFWAGNVIISPNYLEVAGVPLLRGRTFDNSDILGAPNVVIVNEAMAEGLWPGEDPLGKRFRWARGMSGSLDSFEDEFFPLDWMTVVGVAGNVRRRSLAEAPIAEFYRPFQQMSWPSMALVLATDGTNPNLAADLRRTVAEVDPMVPLSDVRALQRSITDSVSEPRFRLLLVGGFALIACFLAMLGVYAVMALTVTRRTHDIGIRMALGAEQTRVQRQVVADGMRLAVAGAAVGLVLALGVSRFIGAMLYDVAATDPLTYAGVAGLTLLVAAAACYLPARRAARLDPLEALRSV